MNKIEFEECLSRIWRDSRDLGNVSQEHMAKALGVSKKTVQNWEAGEAFPNFKKAVEWFAVLGLPMYPFLMDALYPTEMKAVKSGDINDVKKALYAHIDELDDMRAKELLFCLRGGHGSSPTGTIDLCSAYLSMPLQERVSIASTTLLFYDMNPSCESHTNIETLRRYVETAKLAVMEGKFSYMYKEDKE